VKYTNTTPHVSLDGIHAVPNQVKFILPREAPKGSAPSSLEREAKRPRTTIAILEDRVESLKQALALVTSTVRTMSRQIEMNMLEISNLKKENERLVREMARLAKKD
jgi:chromosome segregation ATPase